MCIHLTNFVLKLQKCKIIFDILNNIVENKLQFNLRRNRHANRVANNRYKQRQQVWHERCLRELSEPVRILFIAAGLTPGGRYGEEEGRYIYCTSYYAISRVQSESSRGGFRVGRSTLLAL